MKLKLIGVTVGVLLAVTIIGIGTLWAQGGGPTATPAPANPQATPSAPNYCQQYMQSLAQHLGVSVDRLTQASKDAAKDMIDQAVKDGRLTQDQANTAKQRIDQMQGQCGFKGFSHWCHP